MIPKIFLFLFITTFFFIGKNISAQSFGFGCLGLSGVYGGYSYQTFQAEGLNNYLNNEFYFNREDIKFSSAHGFRIGANLFRAKFAEYFLTAKAYYQFLDNNQTMNYQTRAGDHRNEFNLSMDYWAFGFDLGLPVARFIDWKILEGLLTFNKVRLRQDVYLNGELEQEILFKKDGMTTGYYFGTGVVFQVIPAYLSIEGSAGYNFVSMDRFDDTVVPEELDNIDFVNKGGIGISLQANLSIPL